MDPHDLIDPGFQHGGHAVIVHRRRDHQHLGRLKCRDQRLRFHQRLRDLLSHRRRENRRAEIRVNQRRRVGRQVMHAEFGAWVTLAQAGDDFFRHTAAERRGSPRTAAQIQNFCHRSVQPHGESQPGRHHAKAALIGKYHEIAGVTESAAEETCIPFDIGMIPMLTAPVRSPPERSGQGQKPARRLVHDRDRKQKAWQHKVSVYLIHHMAYHQNPNQRLLTGP